MAADHVTIAVAALGAAATGALISLMPSVSDVREAQPGSTVHADMDAALVIGSGVALGLAGVSSVAAKNAWPLFVTVVGIILVLLGYKWALHTDGKVSDLRGLLGK